MELDGNLQMWVHSLTHRRGAAPVPVCPIPDSNHVRLRRRESVRHRFSHDEYASCCGNRVQRSHCKYQPAA